MQRFASALPAYDLELYGASAPPFAGIAQLWWPESDEPPDLRPLVSRLTGAPLCVAATTALVGREVRFL